jgi:hypothetical protein
VCGVDGGSDRRVVYDQDEEEDADEPSTKTRRSMLQGGAAGRGGALRTDARFLLRQESLSLDAARTTIRKVSVMMCVVHH